MSRDEPLHPHPHVELVDDESIIKGTRIPARRLWSWHRQGTAIETILRRYPQLGPARVFDALAYAYDNLERITRELVDERERVMHAAANPPEDPKDCP